MSTATIQKMTNTFTLPSKKDLLISGYSKLKLPPKIKYLCILFAFNIFENKYIPFSTKFKTKNGIELTENNKRASKSDYHRSSWIVSDIEPVRYGIRCWRILVNNPKQAFIRFAVGSKRTFSEDSVYGIAYNKKRKLAIWRPAGNISSRNKIDLQHFASKKCVVDMLLDADNGILKICVVGMCDDEHEAKIWNMATTNLYQRWVPHFTFGSSANGAQLQVTEIYKGYYGKDMNINPITNIELIGYIEKRYKYDFAMDILKIRNKNKNNKLTFHFCGIQPLKSHKINTNMFDNMNINCITINSSLCEMDTIESLKQLVRETYGLLWCIDIVILYCDKIISIDNTLSLNHFNITNGSLFILAIANYSYCINLGWKCQRCTFLNSCDKGKCEMCDSVTNQLDITYVKAQNPLLFAKEKIKHKTDTFNALKTDKLSIKPIKGFDIISQESNVDVYCMSDCNHVMSKDSLYNYALNTLKDDNNLYIKCPYPNDKYNSYEWACVFCTFVNKMNRNTCEMCDNIKPEITPYCDTKWKYYSIKNILISCINDKFDIYKLELLLARNKIQKTCDVQKCPICNTLYYRNDDNNKLKLNEIQSMQTINQHFKTRCVICNDNKIESKYDEIESDISPLMVKAQMNQFGTLPFGMEKPIRWKPVNDKCIVSVKNEYNGYFCWGCGNRWEYGHICDTSFKKDLVEILMNADRKKIGSVNNVPSIRACLNCAQLITHSDACKHMACKQCKLDFCFVCLKPKKNGNWQCGNHSAVCAVAPPQNMDTLPNTIVLNKNTFKLF